MEVIRKTNNWLQARKKKAIKDIAKKKPGMFSGKDVKDIFKKEVDAKRSAANIPTINPSDPEALSKVMRMLDLESNQNEEAQGAVTTGNIGSPTMATGEPAKGGSSALYYPKVGPMVSRRGDIKPKKKKKVREFTEYYFNKE